MVKKTLIIGLGVSGRAAASFLLKKHEKVIAVDRNPSPLEGVEVLAETAPLDFNEIKQVILSPGVPPEHRCCVEAKKRGIEVIGEAELAFRHAKNRCIGITGSNGKTTVTLLVTHLLKTQGLKARALGNVGDPLTLYFIDPDPEEIVVAELSSYQLETMSSKVFDAGVILNITPNHLDRYPSMESYAEAKCRLQNCMKPEGEFFVYEKAAAEFGKFLNPTQCKTFGNQKTSDFWTDDKKAQNRETVEYFVPLSYKGIGIHDRENLLAAWSLCRAFGLTKEAFLQGAESFVKPPHRIEFVKEIGGVRYIDDSKGTSVDAVIQAVKGMKGPVILIAGGVDKGASYCPWKEVFKDRVKQIIAIGQAAEKIQRELQDQFAVKIANTLEQAVSEAAEIAQRGDFVLLSPGCSSFDMFRDYAARGDEFKRLVHHLEERK